MHISWGFQGRFLNTASSHGLVDGTGQVSAENMYRSLAKTKTARGSYNIPLCKYWIDTQSAINLSWWHLWPTSSAYVFVAVSAKHGRQLPLPDDLRAQTTLQHQQDGRHPQCKWASRTAIACISFPPRNTTWTWSTAVACVCLPPRNTTWALQAHSPGTRALAPAADQCLRQKTSLQLSMKLAELQQERLLHGACSQASDSYGDPLQISLQSIWNCQKLSEISFSATYFFPQALVAPLLTYDQCQADAKRMQMDLGCRRSKPRAWLSPLYKELWQLGREGFHQRYERVFTTFWKKHQRTGALRKSVEF